MLIQIQIADKQYSCDLKKGLDISIPLVSDGGVVAFGADPYTAQPFSSGEFVGSLNAGAPVNFYNIFINPHGNGTHTETVNHIDKRGHSIYDTLKQSHFITQLITITPNQRDNGDRVIEEEQFYNIKILELAQALVIRTTPNTTTKLTQNYTGTNPCYIDYKFIQQLNKTNVDHLLIDIPSVDREVDGGKLSAHNAFWNTEDNLQLKKTITEMVYIDNDILDGLYLLNLQTISVDIDASPSKPILYALNEI